MGEKCPGKNAWTVAHWRGGPGFFQNIDGIMAYKELIKDFKRIRDYMRAFYVYGYLHRDDFDAKSARSYDNERRRIESWLGDYLSFRWDEQGKAVFLSVDSRKAAGNPLYRAWKTKSFTSNDITLHFYLLDLLREYGEQTVKELTDRIAGEYFEKVGVDLELDESTVRKKLNEYVELGLIGKRKQGRDVFYEIGETSINLQSWTDACAFFSEAAPLGVTGSFLLDQISDVPDYYRFKHHYVLHALDSEILFGILMCMGEQSSVILEMQEAVLFEVWPMKIYISTQNGRQYLLGYVYETKKLQFFRLDRIVSVGNGTYKGEPQQSAELYEQSLPYLWGVVIKELEQTEHVEMLIRAEKTEPFVVERLKREKRVGHVEQVDDVIWKYTADVFDAMEMLPWIRTFTGRILEFHCSNADAEKRFIEDLEAMRQIYGVK